MRFLLLLKARFKAWFERLWVWLSLLLGPGLLLALLHTVGRRSLADYLLAPNALPAVLVIGFGAAGHLQIALNDADARSGSLYAKSLLPMSGWLEYGARLLAGVLCALLPVPLTVLCGLAAGADLRVPPVGMILAMALAALFYACLACAVPLLLKGRRAQRVFSMAVFPLTLLFSGAVVNETFFSDTVQSVWRCTVPGSFKHLLACASLGQADVSAWLVPGLYTAAAFGFSLLFFRSYGRSVPSGKD